MTLTAHFAQISKDKEQRSGARSMQVPRPHTALDGRIMPVSSFAPDLDDNTATTPQRDPNVPRFAKAMRSQMASIDRERSWHALRTGCFERVRR